MKKTLTALGLVLMTAAPALADTFTNGGFESGDLSGWTQGGGYWFGGWPIDPSTYEPGGANHNISGNRSGIVSPGLDPLTDNNLNRVYSGNYSARINDQVNDYTVSTISQTVANYSDANIFFAWAAVLQESHGPTDSGNFTLKLTNDTDGTTLYQVDYSSASAAGAGLFTRSSSGWYYTDWQIQQLDVSADIGDTFTLTLLASDCPYGGHAGYVYLDGFGAVLPPPGPDGVPEPATLAMLGLGLGALGLARRRWRS